VKALPILMTLWAVMGHLAAGGQAAELKGGRVAVTVAEKGGGFIDSIRYRGRQIVRAPDGFVGSAVELAAAGEGTVESLFGNRTAATLRAAIADVRVQAGRMTVRGTYTGGEHRVPFTRRIDLLDGDAISVTEEADFRGLDAKHGVARHALHLPLVVHKDPHLRMFGFGGAHRAELFRMDMNDVTRRGKQLISASRGHRPYWDVAGVLQLPASYRIWRANHADTMAYPVEAGEGTPGWADYSEPDWGLTVHTADTRALSIVIDARAGVLTVSPLPPEGMPQAGADLGRRAFAFTLALHEKSWPTTYPCELDYGRYKKLLALLNPEGRYTHLDYLCGALGLMTKEGPKSPAELDALARRIVLRERVQPSTLLRLLYRGDGWRMSGIVRSVLGRTVPRNQPLHAWNTLAADVLGTLRQ